MHDQLYFVFTTFLNAFPDIYDIFVNHYINCIDLKAQTHGLECSSIACVHVSSIPYLLTFIYVILVYFIIYFSSGLILHGYV
jgi:hypothetical protein